LRSSTKKAKKQNFNEKFEQLAYRTRDIFSTIHNVRSDKVISLDAQDVCMGNSDSFYILIGSLETADSAERSHYHRAKNKNLNLT
jgi:hypothetical protein